MYMLCGVFTVQARIIRYILDIVTIVPFLCTHRRERVVKNRLNCGRGRVWEIILLRVYIVVARVRVFRSKTAARAPRVPTKNRRRRLSFGFVYAFAPVFGDGTWNFTCIILPVIIPMYVLSCCCVVTIACVRRAAVRRQNTEEARRDEIFLPKIPSVWDSIYKRVSFGLGRRGGRARFLTRSVRLLTATAEFQW